MGYIYPELTASGSESGSWLGAMWPIGLGRYARHALDIIPGETYRKPHIIKKEKQMKIQEWLLAKEKEEGVGSTLIKDIAQHGCQGGVPGIIYYNETVAFYAQHEEEIFEQLEDYAEQEGLKLGEKVQQVARDAGSLRQLKNNLVWWAVEVRAQQLLDQRAAA